MFGKEAQHVLFVIGELGRKKFWQRKHGPPKKSGTKNDFDRHRHDRLCRGLRDFRMLGRRTGIEFHHTCDVGHRFHSAKRENDAYELNPRHDKIRVRRLQLRHSQMRAAE